MAEEGTSALTCRREVPGHRRFFSENVHGFVLLSWLCFLLNMFFFPEDIHVFFFGSFSFVFADVLFLFLLACCFLHVCFWCFTPSILLQIRLQLLS